MISDAGAAKRVGIIQSNYVPWKGYFDFIDSVDEFIVFDTVQYTRRNWRNRNQIKTREGLRWLTIPVDVKGRYLQNVNEMTVAEPDWIGDHLRALRHAYARAPFFEREWPFIEDAYHACSDERYLSKVNCSLLRALCERLGIRTPIRLAEEFETPDGKNERLISLCLQTGAAEYVSGPAAKAYIDAQAFEAHGLRVRYKSYTGYKPYEQMHPPFEHGVTILDVLFNTGPDAAAHIKSSTPFEEDNDE